MLHFGQDMLKSTLMGEVLPVCVRITTATKVGQWVPVLYWRLEREKRV